MIQGKINALVKINLIEPLIKLNIILNKTSRCWYFIATIKLDLKTQCLYFDHQFSALSNHQIDGKTFVGTKESL